MDPRQLFVDSRLTGMCVYCGQSPDTVDHVPSKILLDDPLPPNLPVIEACSGCNHGFSLDEQYLACLVECVISGTAEPGGALREKVRKTLARSPSLVRLLENCKRIDTEGRLLWEPDNERVRNVVLKLAQGHAAYELGLPRLGDPDQVFFAPLEVVTESDRRDFENGGASGGLCGWSEIGSRAFLREAGTLTTPGRTGKWNEIQPGRYRYSVAQSTGVLVQIVMSEYLACTVEWE